MKREAFEKIVQQALDSLAADQPKDNRSRKRNAAIGGVRYGAAAKAAASAVVHLAAPGKVSRPISIPSPWMVPPCF